MSDLALDGLSRSRLDWPEAVLIDLISESYAGTQNVFEPIVAARLHTRFLHELVDGDARAAASLRLELIATCAARQIGVDAIERADRAAFRELESTVFARFRKSTRLRDLYSARLREALARLPQRDTSLRPAAGGRGASRAATPRPPLLLSRTLALSA